MGYVKPLSERTKHNDCGSCVPGYYLDGGSCKAWGRYLQERHSEMAKKAHETQRLLAVR